MRLAAIILSLTVAVGAQTPSPAPTVELMSSDPRPLSQVILDLQYHLERTVTYEASPLLHADDIAEFRSRASNFLGVYHGILQREIAFRFALRLPVDNSDAGVSAVLQDLVNQFNQTRRAGLFKVTQTGRIFHVVPEFVKSASGNFEPYVSPLDTRISIPDGQRSAAEQVELIKAAVHAAGPRFGVGTVPINALVGTPISGGVHNESARVALTRVIERLSSNATWRYLCGEGPNPYCMLNITGYRKSR